MAPEHSPAESLGHTNALGCDLRSKSDFPNRRLVGAVPNQCPNGTLLKTKQESVYKAIPIAKNCDPIEYSHTDDPHRKRSSKRLPIAIAKSVVRMNYPSEVEELCQVLELIIKRRLSEDSCPLD